MAYRVVEWSTGSAGFAALRGIVGHPDLELVGVWGDTDAAVGLEASDFAAAGAAGVLVSDDLHALLALIPDCVCYTAAAADRPQAVEDLTAILRSGANVVVPSLRDLVPAAASATAVPETLQAAADEGAASLFAPDDDVAGASTYERLLTVVDAIPAVCRARPGVLSSSEIWPPPPGED